MPIHAAGIYCTSTPICVSDFFVSSYTPSIGALLDAWKHVPPRPTSHFKVLAAIQPNPRHRWSRLPEVGNELREILDSVPKENLVGLGTSDEQDFDGIHMTVENVVDKLSEANIYISLATGLRMQLILLAVGSSSPMGRGSPSKN